MEILASIIGLLIACLITVSIKAYHLAKSLEKKEKRIVTLTGDYDKMIISRDNLQMLFQQVEERTKTKLQQEFEAWKVIHEKKIRKSSVDRSRSTLRGQAVEHLAPLMMENLNPKDCRFLGNPIDYIVFSGASNVTDGKQDQIDRVIFLEIKSGKSTLNKVQRRIRNAIKEGKVDFVIYNPDTKTTAITKRNIQ